MLLVKSVRGGREPSAGSLVVVGCGGEEWSGGAEGCGGVQGG